MFHDAFFPGLLLRVKNTPNEIEEKQQMATLYGA